MKITITKEFETVEAAYAFLETVANTRVLTCVVNDPKSFTAFADGGVVEESRQEGPAYPAYESQSPVAAPAKKLRKPRSDAGKVRGPYKTAGGAPDGTPSTTAPTSAAPASPPAPEPAAPVQDGVLLPEPTVATPTGGAPAAADLTIDDARAALKRINNTKGLGTPVCIGHLQGFGVNRISDLPKDQYAEFIRRADEMIAKHTAK